MPVPPLPTESVFLCSPHAGEARAQTRIYYALLALVLIVVLVPLWLVDYPGMTDYPNHLARCYILAHYFDSPVWQQRFYVDLKPIPNLGFDLIVVALARFVPILVAGKIFLSISAALFVLGSSELGKAITGRANWLALVCAFAFYNAELLMGFESFVLCIGVFLFAFAYWLRHRKRLTAWSFLICCLFSIAAFMTHLSAFILLAAACFTVAVLDFASERKPLALLRELAWLVCPLVMMVVYMKVSGRAHAGTLDVHSLWPRFGKLSLLLSPVASYSPALKRVCEFVFPLGLLALLKGGKIHRTAIVGAVFVLMLVFTPEGLLNTSFAAERYAVPFCLVVMLSIEPCWGRLQKCGLGLIVLLMLIRVGNITTNWLEFDRESRQMLAMGDVLPRGARVFALRPIGPATSKPTSQPAGLATLSFVHVNQMWTMTHEADVSTLLAQAGQQPLIFRQPLCHTFNTVGMESMECFRGFDFVLTDDPTPPFESGVSSVATPAATWEKMTLWRVNDPIALCGVKTVEPCGTP